ncbi:MAG TPA: YraN family protein [Solirubrobacteraceae bacterium]|nr:YraN family protein [Solirubrobacteraceae bacterium]
MNRGPPRRSRSVRGAAAQQLGVLGEQLAARHLERRGCTILACNAHVAGGEIDLVALHGDTLVFVEVKTTRQPIASSGEPLGRLLPRQRARLRRLAGAWLAGAEHPPARRLRLDAIGVRVDGRGRLIALDHVEGAW